MDSDMQDVIFKRGRDRHRDGLFWGPLLILLGIGFLLRQLGLVQWDAFQHWWTWLVVAMGVAGLISSRRPKSIGNNVMLIFMGGYLWVSDTNWMGLNWGNSWPLALIAVGAGMIARSIAAMVMSREAREEDRHEL